MKGVSVSAGVSLERLRALRARLLDAAMAELAPDRAIRSYCWFLALKLLCTFNLVMVWAGSYGPWLRVLSVACSIAMLRPTTASAGVLGWLGLMAAHVAFTWPYTLNHFFLELAFLLVLSLHPRAGRDVRASREALTLLFTAMVSVWFFSGVQKVVQGHYLNGEAFALELLGANSHLGTALRSGLTVMDQVFNVADFPEAASPSQAPIVLSGVGRVYCLVLSWLVPASECALALGVFIARRRERIVGALLLAQLGIAFVSKEYDFALTGLAALGLGWRRWVDVRHAILALAALALSFGGSS